MSLRSSTRIAALFALAALLGGCGGAMHNSVIPSALNSAANGAAAQTLDTQMSTDASSSNTTAFKTLAAASGATGIFPMTDTSGTLSDLASTVVSGVQGSTVSKAVHGIAFNSSAATGFNGGAFSLPGFDYTKPSTALQPPAQLTVEFWVKPAAYNTSGTTETLLSYGVASPSGLAYRVQLTSPYNQVNFVVRTNSSKQYVSAFGSTRLAVGTTYHVVGTYNGTTAQLFINGQADGTAGTGSGTIYYYPGTAGTYGLGIGGQPSSTVPIFNGTMQSVAIYPSALSAATVEQHYQAGLSTTPVVANPGRAGTFINSVAMNTHFSYQGSQWDTDYSTVKSLLVGLGVKHIRDKLTDTAWTTYFTHLNDLAASGIKSTLTQQSGATASDITTVASYASSSIEAFEGLNEPDLDGNGWEATTTAAQKLLYTTVKGDSRVSSLPVLGPSLTSPGNAQLLGSLSTYLDYGNIHDYFGQDYPGNTGFGSYQQWGYGGAIPFWMNWETIVAGSKPVMTTETGYGTSTAYHNGIDANVQAKYLLRTYLEQYNAGIKRTFNFQLMDEQPIVENDQFVDYGLITTSLAPKPSYYALKSLMTALADSASNSTTFATSQLTYLFAGNTDNVHHSILQKSDGSYAICFWVEASDWNESANVEQSVPSQAITLKLGTQPTDVTLTTISSSGTATKSTPVFTGAQANLTATDTVQILTFKE